MVVDWLIWGLLIAWLGIVVDNYLVPKIIGWFGEHWTKQALKKLPKNEYKIINNVMLKLDGTTHQIDHIVVSKYGIFVIETKQYNGYITGSKYDKKWVKHYKGGNVYYYTNPIRQNYGHVKTIQEIFNLDDNQVFNLVCIPSNAKLNIKHDGELVNHLNICERIESHKDVVIDNPQEIVENLKSKNIDDIFERHNHNKNIKKSVNNFNSKDTCPQCGGKLVLRKGYSDFLGCSNYPKCKYTRKLK